MIDADTRLDEKGLRPAPAPPLAEVVVEPRTGWRAINFGEIYQYRDLLWFLTHKYVKGRHAQSALGVGWVLVQPLLSLAIFVLVFGRVVGIRDPGGAPYLLFALCGLVPWTYFSGAMTAASTSLISEASLIPKVYFPRLILPLAQVMGRLVDLAAMLVITALVFLAYRQVPRPEALVMIPLLTLLATAAALGVGMWLAALAIRYRDIAHMIQFLAQIWMYLCPVVYPASKVPERYKFWYDMNPMSGVITGFRSCLLGSPAMPWGTLAQGAAVSAFLLVGGALFFRRAERIFADVI